MNHNGTRSYQFQLILCSVVSSGVTGEQLKVTPQLTVLHTLAPTYTPRYVPSLPAWASYDGLYRVVYTDYTRG
jgi:hypothetical protein